jgi:hypothetical protein
MVQKKKSVKRKVSGSRTKSVASLSKNREQKKSMKMEACATDENYKCKIVCVKLAAMAFILFLIQVWPAAMDLVHRIHWGWFLGAMVLFAMGACNKSCRYKK